MTKLTVLNICMALALTTNSANAFCVSTQKASIETNEQDEKETFYYPYSYMINLWKYESYESFSKKIKSNETEGCFVENGLFKEPNKDQAMTCYPEFKGGSKALEAYIDAHTTSHDDLYREGVSGQVIVNFVINTDGSISEATIARSVHPTLDQEALNIVSAMPRWKPGRVNGKKVKCVNNVAVNYYNLKDIEEVYEYIRTKNQFAVYNHNLYTVNDAYSTFPECTKYDDSCTRIYKGWEGLQYPEDAYNKGVEGTVWLSFIVEADGSVSNIKIAKSVSKELDQEAVRYLKENLKGTFVPATYLGKNVRARFWLPFDFDIKNYPQPYPPLLVYNSVFKEFDFPNKEYAIEDGEVNFKATVDTNGEVKDLHISKSANQKADELAFKFANQLRWTPGKTENKATAKDIDFTIGFENNSMLLRYNGMVFDIRKYMPEFPGGNDGLVRYFTDNTHYPIIAIENDVQGVVVVNFTVDKHGLITDPYISKAVDPLLDREALRVVKALPRFLPGYNGWKKVSKKYSIRTAVPTRMSLTVVFCLANKPKVIIQ